MKTLKQFVKESHIPEKLIRATVRQFGGWQSFRECYHDVAKYGMGGGFHGFIASGDTCPFAKKNRKEIIQMLFDYADEMDVSVEAFVASFEFFNQKMDSEDRMELYRFLSRNIKKNDVIIPNLMAWFAADEVCRSYDELNDELYY